MDISDKFKKPKYDETEKMLIEIFLDSSDSKYFKLGVARGVYIIYDLIDKFKDKIKNNQDWLDIIKQSTLENEDVGEYFKRLLSEKNR